jgi:hypothetical protein
MGLRASIAQALGAEEPAHVLSLHGAWGLNPAE